MQAGFPELLSSLIASCAPLEAGVGGEHPQPLGAQSPLVSAPLREQMLLEAWRPEPPTWGRFELLSASTSMHIIQPGTTARLFLAARPPPRAGPSMRLQVASGSCGSQRPCQLACPGRLSSSHHLSSLPPNLKRQTPRPLP